jgi:hypothetical protein
MHPFKCHKFIEGQDINLGIETKIFSRNKPQNKFHDFGV